ncbi:uncharacterized protein WM277_013044 isoform 2-T4 [Molossus nigricans]
MTRADPADVAFYRLREQPERGKLSRRPPSSGLRPPRDRVGRREKNIDVTSVDLQPNCLGDPIIHTPQETTVGTNHPSVSVPVCLSHLRQSTAPRRSRRTSASITMPQD